MIDKMIVKIYFSPLLMLVDCLIVQILELNINGCTVVRS